MAEEIFDFVNERDEVIGQAPRREVHARGWWHRAVHVLVFNARGEVFLQKRSLKKDSAAGKWDSSSAGHLDTGEDYDPAAVRELREELGIEVAGNCLGAFTFASHAYPKFHLLMPLYLCRRWRGTPQGREGQALAWVRPEKLSEYKMPPADLPLIGLLRDLL